MRNITIEEVRDGNIESCRDLCNELMAFQKAQSFMSPESFDGMNFDTRMKRSFDGALRSQVIVAKEDGVPIGYVFSSIDEETEESRTYFPDWAPNKDLPGVIGFFPEWVALPKKIGCFNNLYIKEGYRDLKLGTKLLEMSMNWLESFDDTDLTFVYISNGNDVALKFYLKHGFTYSHEVFGGFIKAAYKKK